MFFENSFASWPKYPVRIAVYAHILDEDRKVNPQMFETAFYANSDLRKVQAPKEESAVPETPSAIDLFGIMAQLQKSPELAAALTAMLSAASGGR